MGEEIRSLEAKVSVGGSCCGGWGDLADRVEVGGSGAKGLEEVEEACEDAEKGLALIDFELRPVTPNSAAPRSFVSFCDSGLGALFLSFA